ncbi:hypothetical protein Zm00014a_001838 [Zea mays]|uniref:Uncharacterized protein n=1 Tax=Zea mays TaxID=4577 RepID=A0A3L6DDC1_MAIZE|nr:hypothetical protein Zm00014a_001838 [Zea mays]
MYMTLCKTVFLYRTLLFYRLKFKIRDVNE